MKESPDDAFLPPFRIFPREDSLKGWRDIFRGKPAAKYPAGTVIVEQGSRPGSLYYIAGGLAEYRTVRSDGSEISIELLGEGNLFGLQPMFGGGAAAGELAALGDTRIILFSKEEVFSQIRKNPALAVELLEELASISGGLIRQAANRELSAEERITELLYAVSVRLGSPTVPLTQTDIARICRTSRVTVSKTLAALKALRAIDTAYGGIRITDPSCFSK